MPDCPVCTGGLTQAPLYRLREQMYGTKEWFVYAQCLFCHSLSLQNPPADWQGYYPTDYYSLQPKPQPAIKQWLRHQRDLYLLGQTNPLGWMLSHYWHDEAVAALGWLALKPHTRILDVGCGHGQLLRWLQHRGFQHLTGVDPFLPQPQAQAGLTLISGTLLELQGQWDVLMFHHTLEHVPNVRETLQAAWQRLVPGGYCLVRIPTVSSWAWTYYHTCWVQWDAPRHQVLFSRQGFEQLVGDIGFQIQVKGDESTAFQFWGSEQYRCGIPLMDAQSYFMNPHQSLFKPAQIRAYHKQAQHLNRLKQGDAVAYVLLRP